MCLRTPLYDRHVALGGKIVPFAGYLLPVQYGTGVIAEHMAVREKCGLFDVSHMGEVHFSGKGALNTLNFLLCNDMSGMSIGQVRYSPMCNERGGVVDDLVVLRAGEEDYLMVVNAANRHKDVEWMRTRLMPDTQMEDLSDGIAQVALQGPRAPEILRKLCREENIPKRYYSAVTHGEVAGVSALISRTGYTGELGYEIYCANDDVVTLWDALLKAGKDEGLIPCGLGARDTLRLEAAMPLYGHEMSDEITPLEAGLDHFVKLDKPDFIGRDALLKLGAPKRARVGLSVTGHGIVREQCDLFMNGVKVGVSTSGTYCPYLKQPVAMALADVACAEEGTALEADVRGRRVGVTIVPLPFYKRAK